MSYKGNGAVLVPNTLGTAGQVLTVNSGATAGEWSTPNTSGPPTMQVFTSSGTWTKPTGCKFVKVYLQGGGAGGTDQSAGAEGACAITMIDVSSVSSSSIVVGEGGAGALASSYDPGNPSTWSDGVTSRSSNNTTSNTVINSSGFFSPAYGNGGVKGGEDYAGGAGNKGVVLIDEFY